MVGNVFHLILKSQNEKLIKQKRMLIIRSLPDTCQKMHEFLRINEMLKCFLIVCLGLYPLEGMYVTAEPEAKELSL